MQHTKSNNMQMYMYVNVHVQAYIQTYLHLHMHEFTRAYIDVLESALTYVARQLFCHMLALLDASP